MNLLLRTHRSTTLRLAAVPPHLLRMFEIVGVDTVLDNRPTVEAALEDPA